MKIDDVKQELFDEIFNTKMPFGKYKDILVKDLPQSYLIWASENLKDDDLRWRCKIEISRRKGFK
jgi:hypothetical protein